MKLGEALVISGFITQDQLKQALERQVIFGGRIGTNLVELGFVKEEDILSFFSKYFRTPAVKPSLLDEIDPEVVSSLPADIAEKYCLIPFRRDRNRLHVAMLDPRSFDRIEEIRFKTGFDIVPYVITELRLLYCLERYYGIKRNHRFVSFQNKAHGTDEETSAQDWSRDAARVAEQFAGVHDKNDVIDVLLNETASVTARAAVFEVNGVLITGWGGRGLIVDGFELALDGTSAFDEVLRTRSLYRAPLPSAPGNAKLIERLGGTPKDCCMIPVLFHDKVLAILYVDNGNEDVLDASLTCISTFVGMAGIGFEFVLLRKKLFQIIQH